MIIEVTINQKNGDVRRIGLYNTDSKIWFVERNKKIHYMRTLKGWGLDSKMYDILKDKYGMGRVMMTETSTSKVYECYVETIESEKIYKTFHPHRLQIFIPAIYWKMIDDGKIR